MTKPPALLLTLYLSLLLSSCVQGDFHIDCEVDAECADQNQVCRYRSCVERPGECREGLRACGEACVDPTTLEHCGGCGGCPAVPRATATACEAGQCVYACDAGWRDGDGMLGAGDVLGCECPAASGAEVCNGVDDDCNGLIDGDDPGLDLSACGAGATSCKVGVCLYE